MKAQNNNSVKPKVGNSTKPLLSPVVRQEILENWDDAYVDLNRNGGMFIYNDVRLRNCSLNYNETCQEYYVTYKNVTFGLHDIYNRR